MTKVLITGPTGNIGRELISFLYPLQPQTDIHCAVQDLTAAKKAFQDFEKLSFVKFDLENPQTFDLAFRDVEILFLLRPPHISQVEKVFRPLLESAKNHGIHKVVFVSVQGVDQSSIIPHHKIEELIRELHFDYIFVRPAYFMQNLTTALLKEIQTERSITLPSGDAKFNWVDTKNIGEAAALLIHSFEKYKNQAFEITGLANLDFTQVCELMTEILGEEIKFKSINPVSFFFKKKREGIPMAFAGVMTMLHFLPRLQEPPTIHGDYQKITGEKPTALTEFITREKNVFLKSSK